METYSTRGKVELFPQKGGWTYIRVPKKITKELLFAAQRGLIPITAHVGTSTWKTSLLPMGDGTHFIALNAKVRKAQNISAGKTITISFEQR